eukprot:scaffold71225_cov38-Cyclotella_meneghiniana.AAC.3
MAMTGEVLVATVELMFFSKHFADHCRDCRTSNEVKSRIKEILYPKILWKGDRIRCMKSAPQCKLCMVERKEICHS